MHLPVSQNKTTMKNIELLSRPTRSMKTIADEVLFRTVPILSVIEGPICDQWIIFSAIYSLLQSDPARFSERIDNPTYTNTIFYTGHSPED